MRVTLSRRCVNVDACKGGKDVERETVHRLLFVFVEAAGNEEQNANLLGGACLIIIELA